MIYNLKRIKSTRSMKMLPVHEFLADFEF